MYHTGKVLALITVRAHSITLLANTILELTNSSIVLTNNIMMLTGGVARQLGVHLPEPLYKPVHPSIRLICARC